MGTTLFLFFALGGTNVANIPSGKLTVSEHHLSCDDLSGGAEQLTDVPLSPPPRLPPSQCPSPETSTHPRSSSLLSPSDSPSVSAQSMSMQSSDL